MELVFTAGFLHTFSINFFLVKYPTRHSARFFNYYLAGPRPTLKHTWILERSQPCYKAPGDVRVENHYNAVINIGLVKIVPSIIAQKLTVGQPKNSYKIYQTYFPSKNITQNVFLNSYSANW